MNKTLNPKLWKDFKLNKKVRKNLLEIAKDFIDDIDIPNLSIKDVIFTGSNASYNWHKGSDLDLHIIISLKNIESKTEKEAIKKSLLLKKQIWNYSHEIMLYGSEVEIYPQTPDSQLKANGIFSLKTNKWIKKPNHEITNKKIDKEEINKKYKSIKNDIAYIKELSEENNPNYNNILGKIKSIKDKIKKMRQTSLEVGGEISTGNLIFKLLRNNGDLQILSDLSKQLYDKKYTIETMLNENLEIYESEPTIGNIKKSENNNGWISPSGDYYACNFYGHISLAKRLFDSDKVKYTYNDIKQGDEEEWLENLKWLKLTDGRFFSMSNSLTQAQLDKIFDYVESRDKKEIIFNGSKMSIRKLFQMA